MGCFARRGGYPVAPAAGQGLQDVSADQSYWYGENLCVRRRESNGRDPRCPLRHEFVAPCGKTLRLLCVFEASYKEVFGGFKDVLRLGQPGWPGWGAKGWQNVACYSLAILALLLLLLPKYFAGSGGNFFAAALDALSRCPPGKELGFAVQHIACSILCCGLNLVAFALCISVRLNASRSIH